MSATDVPCPCGADIGEPCYTPSGGRINYSHTDRWAKWRKTRTAKETMTHNYIVIFTQNGDGDVLHATSGQFYDQEQARAAVLAREYVKEVVAVAEHGDRLHEVIPPTEGKVTSIPWKGTRN